MRTEGSPTPTERYPIDVTADLPESSSRLLAVTGILFLKLLLALPHFLVLYFVQIAAFLIAWIGYFAILFTGRLPEGFHRFITGWVRWNARVTGWMFSLTDRYPPFSLDGGSARGEQGT